MISQTILNFKIEKTNDEITPRAGLALLGEYAQGLGLEEKVTKQLPKPRSGRGFGAWEYVNPLILMLNGGGRALEDIREISNDCALRELLEIKRVPEACTIGDWLRRMSERDGLKGLGKVNNYLIEKWLEISGKKELVLDIDATEIRGEKREAKYTYKGNKGYMPMVGTLNGEMIVGEEFRQGNESPSSRNLDFIKYCESRLPRGKKLRYIRADSASYQAEIFNWCEKNNKKFVIGGRLDSAVLKSIEGIGEESWEKYGNGHIAWTVHCMEKTEKSFYLIVIKRPFQTDMFEEPDEKIRYRVLATNMDVEKYTPERIVAWYNKRGEESENRIKELKNDFGMERMPCSDFGANAVFFRIGVIAYNLFKLFKRVALPESYKRYRVTTIRWRLYNVAGKVTMHARNIWLRINVIYKRLFEQIRKKAYMDCYG